MANGVIIPSDDSVSWIEINANLKYKVVNGIVFVWIKSQSDTSVNIGSIPAAFRPKDADCFFALLADTYISPLRYWNVQVYRTGEVYTIGNTGYGLMTTICYPLN